MIRPFPNIFKHYVELPALALRFCAAVVIGLAVLIGSIVVLVLAALAIAVFGDVPPRHSVEG
jgi:hypothetical protein